MADGSGYSIEINTPLLGWGIEFSWGTIQNPGTGLTHSYMYFGGTVGGSVSPISFTSNTFKLKVLVVLAELRLAGKFQ